MTTKTLTILLLILAAFMIVSCASPEAIEPCVDEEQRKGFLYGLLHGFLAPLTFIISLFADSIAMYEVNNTGGWYDFGFLLGIGGFSGGIFKSSKKKK